MGTPLTEIDQAIRKEFDSNKRILTYDEYLHLVSEHPEKQTRGSARYMADMMDFFGKTAEIPGAPPRFKLFDRPIDGLAPKVVGQERVQNQIYRALAAFSRQGINNKLLLLHGPNGSAKSSIIHALMQGLEDYSREPAGALYALNWIFPLERYTKGGIGINSSYPSRKETPPSGVAQSYAKIPEEEIAARIPCELKDHPLLIIPKEQRKAFLEKQLGQSKANAIWQALPYSLSKGDLCHRCRQIADALLTSNGGDFRKVLAYVQIERIYFSRRYREGLVTIEPQMHVDAQYHQLTYHANLAALPPSLQSLNLFSLTGDVIDGNRGLIEFSDLLKRPVDTFKYLLSACEGGSVNIGPSIAYLDTVMLGSTNEVQLDAFKEFPDFTSFKARIELIRVPYLLSLHQETEIYSAQVSQMSGEKHVAPHVAWCASLWAILTRLKKPNSINYSPNVSTLVSNMTPMEKARLYDTGEMPPLLSPEEKKLLRATLPKLKEEYWNIPYYEGRMGASAREMKSILFDASQNPEFPCLSPLAVFRELEEFVKRVTEYEFLKQDVKDGFHDATEFINIVRNEYLNKIDREVRDCIGLYDSAQWEELLKKYVHQISLALKKEKHKNPITGKLEDPDFALISEVEKIIDAPAEPADKDAFRQNILSQVGAWSLDHPGEAVVYASVFNELWNKLQAHYYESQKSLLTKMHDALVNYNETAFETLSSEGGKLAHQTISNLRQKLGYCDHCAKEVIIFLMRQRY